MRIGKSGLVCITFVLTFLSLSLSLAVTRSDHRYMQVGKRVLAPFGFVQFCLRKPTRCTPSKTQDLIILNTVHRTQLEEVQVSVNRAISPRPKGAPDQPWTDDATVGSCKEYALAKRSRLLDLGYPSSALLLAVAVIPTGEHHLVVVIVTDRGDFVLDNLRTAMVRWDRLPYRWVERSTPENPQFWRAIVPRPRTLEVARLNNAPESARGGCADAS